MHLFLLFGRHPLTRVSIKNIIKKILILFLLLALVRKVICVDRLPRLFPFKMQLFIIVYEKRNELEFHYFPTNINVTHQLF